MRKFILSLLTVLSPCVLAAQGLRSLQYTNDTKQIFPSGILWSNIVAGSNVVFDLSGGKLRINASASGSTNVGEVSTVQLLTVSNLLWSSYVTGDSNTSNALVAQILGIGGNTNGYTSNQVWMLASALDTAVSNGIVSFSSSNTTTNIAQATNAIWPAIADAMLSGNGDYDSVGIYVDSRLGDDANTGSWGNPLRSLKRAVVMAKTVSGSAHIYLARDRIWRESFEIPDNSVVKSYGSGIRPIISGCELLTNGLFTLAAGKTNTYSYPISPAWETNATIIHNSVLKVWDSNIRLKGGGGTDTNVAFIGAAAVESAPGSAWYDATNRLLYVHLSDNANPATITRPLEASVRTLGVWGGTNAVVENLISEKAYAVDHTGGQGYAIRAYGHGVYRNCVGRYSWNHNIGVANYLRNPVGSELRFDNCVAYDCEDQGHSAPTMFVAFYDDDLPDYSGNGPAAWTNMVIFTNCFAFQPAVNQSIPQAGYLAHGAHSWGGNVRAYMDNCSAANVYKMAVIDYSLRNRGFGMNLTNSIYGIEVREGGLTNAVIVKSGSGLLVRSTNAWYSNINVQDALKAVWMDGWTESGSVSVIPSTNRFRYCTFQQVGADPMDVFFANPGQSYSVSNCTFTATHNAYFGTPAADSTNHILGADFNNFSLDSYAISYGYYVTDFALWKTHHPTWDQNSTTNTGTLATFLVRSVPPIEAVGLTDGRGRTIQSWDEISQSTGGGDVTTGQLNSSSNALYTTSSNISQSLVNAGSNSLYTVSSNVAQSLVNSGSNSLYTISSNIAQVKVNAGSNSLYTISSNISQSLVNAGSNSLYTVSSNIAQSLASSKQSGSFALSNLLAGGWSNILASSGIALGTNGGALWITNTGTAGTGSTNLTTSGTNDTFHGGLTVDGPISALGGFNFNGELTISNMFAEVVIFTNAPALSNYALTIGPGSNLVSSGKLVSMLLTNSAPVVVMPVSAPVNTNTVLDLATTNTFYLRVTNNLNVRLTNLVAGSWFSITLNGTNTVATNYGVTWVFPPTDTPYWFGETNSMASSNSMYSVSGSMPVSGIISIGSFKSGTQFGDVYVPRDLYVGGSFMASNAFFSNITALTITLSNKLGSVVGTMSGTGGANTNYTLNGSGGPATTYINAGTTNVNIVGITNTSDAIEYFGTLILTNRTATPRLFSLSSSTINWIPLQQFDGITAPFTVTNSLGARFTYAIRGTNAQYSYKPIALPGN